MLWWDVANFNKLITLWNFISEYFEHWNFEWIIVAELHLDKLMYLVQQQFTKNKNILLLLQGNVIIWKKLNIFIFSL